jgi:hypothetical protein
MSSEGKPFPKKKLTCEEKNKGHFNKEMTLMISRSKRGTTVSQTYNPRGHHHR